MIPLPPKQLKTEWESGKLRPVYLLNGEEHLLKLEALETLKKRLNPDVFNFYEVSGETAKASDLISTACTPPVFADTRLVIARSFDRFPAREKEIIAEYLKNPCASTCLILVSGHKKPKEESARIDCKSGVIATFWPMKPPQCEEWVIARAGKAGKRFSREAACLLVNLLGADTFMLASEIDKIIAYTSGCEQAVSAQQALESMGFTKSENPFEFGRAIMARNPETALKLLEKLLAAGETPLGMLHSISSTLRKIIKARKLLAGGTAESAVFKAAGISQYYNPDFISLVKAFGDDKRLEKTLEQCIYTEAMLKSSSEINPETALKHLLRGIIHRQGNRPKAENSRLKAEG